MVTVTLYRNAYPYPYFSDSLEVYKTVQATPRHQNLKSGYVDLQLTMGNILNFNYIGISGGDYTIYGWVEDIEHRSGNVLYRVHYSTDAYRTYKDRIELGTQFIERSPTPTLLEDELLGSLDIANEYDMISHSIGNTNQRTLVVQLRLGLSNWGSNTPGQPTPYSFFFAPFSVKDWTSSEAIEPLIRRLSQDAKTNIVTMYSIPSITTSGMTLLDSESTPLKVGTDYVSMAGFYYMRKLNIYSSNFITTAPINVPENLTRSRHSVYLVIPEAGTVKIPTELLYMEGLSLRRDIDPFTGISNYMLTTGTGRPTSISIRGGAVSDIPILSDPFDTYLSQNQNTLKASLLGDTATMVTGIAMGEPVGALKGASGLLNQAVSLMDARNVIPSNPPAFFGNALIPTYNGVFYLLVIKKPYDNEEEVIERYGYPYGKVDVLNPTSTGFYQTSNCSVRGKRVPLWAINEINQLFNAGILFK